MVIGTFGYRYIWGRNMCPHPNSVGTNRTGTYGVGTYEVGTCGIGTYVLEPLTIVFLSVSEGPLCLLVCVIFVLGVYSVGGI